MDLASSQATLGLRWHLRDVLNEGKEARPLHPNLDLPLEVGCLCDGHVTLSEAPAYAEGNSQRELSWEQVHPRLWEDEGQRGDPAGVPLHLPFRSHRLGRLAWLCHFLAERP